MPRVPTYQPGSIRNDPLPPIGTGPLAGPSNFGAGDAASLEAAGAGLSKVGYSLGSIALDEQDRLNRSYVRDALSQARTEARDYLEKNVWNQQGLNAANIEGTVKSKLSEIEKAKLDQLQNDPQREVFRQQFTDLADEHLGRVQSFQRQERKRYEAHSIAAENQTFIEQVAGDPTNDELFQRAIKNVAHNEAYMNRGMGSAAMGSSVSKAVSVIASARLNAIATNSPSEGLKFLEANPKLFIPTDFAKYKKHLMDSSAQEKAAQFAQGLDAIPDPAAARAAVDKSGLDPQGQELAMSLYERRQAEIRASNELKQRAAVEGAWKSFLTNPAAPIPTSLPVDEQLKLQKAKAQAAQAQVAGVQNSANGEIASLPADQFAKANLWEYRGRLSPADWNHWYSLQDKLRKGGDTQTENFKVAANEARLLMGEMSYFDISNDRVPKEEDRTRNGHRRFAFMDMVQRRLREIPDAQRTEEGALKIVTELMTDVVKKQSLFGIDWLWKDKVVGKDFEVASGKIPDPNAPATLPSAPLVPSRPREFKTSEEAISANLPDGSTVLVGGKPFRVRRTP